MSEQKKIEIRTSNPLIGRSLESAARLAQEGVPFVAVPVFSPEQAIAAIELGEQNLSAARQEQQQQH